MDEYGDVLARLVDIGQPTERVVVDWADVVVLATNQLVDHWLKDEGNKHVTLDGNVVTFGTCGVGEGRVSYSIDEPHGEHERVLRRLS